MWLQPESSAFGTGVGLDGAHFAAGRRVETYPFGRAPLVFALQRYPSHLSTYCNHGTVVSRVVSSAATAFKLILWGDKLP
jgi:hypothetical protein